MLLLGGPATADDGRALLVRGMKLYDQGRLARSLKVLNRALARIDARAQKTPGSQGRVTSQIHLYIGLCQALSGHEDLARAAFKRALKLRPTLRLPPDRFKPELVKLLASVRGTMLGILEVSTNVPRARVLVNGKARGAAPLLVRVPVGRYKVVVVDLAKKRKMTRKVVVHLGQETQVGVIFKAAPGSAPLPAPAARAPRRIWTWVAAGSTLATLVAGVVVWEWSESSYSNLLEDFSTLKASGEHDVIEQRKDSIHAGDVTATVLFCVAGALAVSSVALFFWEGRAAERRRAAAAPWFVSVVPVAGTTNGLLLITHF